MPGANKCPCLPKFRTRAHLRDFINNVREKLIEGGFIGRSDLQREMTAVEHHLSDPEVLVTSHLFFRLSGRVPSQEMSARSFSTFPIAKARALGA